MELNKVENIITVEDPIEYRLNGINQVQVNPGWADLCQRAALDPAQRPRYHHGRRDPRPGDGAHRRGIGLTGHLVLSTLHTNDAAGAITRLSDMDVEPYLTASAVAAVLAQRLVRLLCKQCRELYPDAEELLASIPDFPLDDADGDRITLYRPAAACAAAIPVTGAHGCI